MLEKIVLQNFKSFKERTEISFYKTNYGILPQNVLENGVLKGTLFVGANASGKSNIILAIKFLLDSLFENNSINSDIYRCLFSKRESFTLEYYFFVNNQHIIYNLDINPSKPFILESLLLEDSLVYERIGQNARLILENGESQTFDEKDIDKETLFLRTIYFNTKFTSNTTLKKWMEYLQSSIYINAYEKKVVGYGKSVQDLEINNYLKNKGSNLINDFFEEYNFNQTVEYEHTAKSKIITITVGGGEEEKAIFFRRKDVSVPVPFLQESLGNQNLLRMFPAFFRVIQEGGILLLDEFSSGFHNDLEELLIKYFMDKSDKSQMIFVSHSTNLLSNSLLRPDQEYSVEFDGANGSIVKRFSSESPRMAQNVEKMYLSGVFGGLPHYEKGINGDTNK